MPEEQKERLREREREAKWPDLFVPRCSDCEADKAKRYEGQALEAAADEVELIFNCVVGEPESKSKCIHCQTVMTKLLIQQLENAQRSQDETAQ